MLDSCKATTPRMLIFAIKTFVLSNFERPFNTGFTVVEEDTLPSAYIWAATRENLSSGIWEQHTHRPACTSTQSDQCLCYSLFGKYHM